MLYAATGRVSAIDQANPAERAHIHLSNQKIFEWLPMGQSLSSAWIEPFKPTSVIKSCLDVEIEDFVRNSIVTSVQFFFRAVHSGNLPAVKTLYSHYKMDVDALDVNHGMSALHVACKNGYLDLVEWLLNEVKANLEVQDKNGFRAIHFAVKR